MKTLRYLFAFLAIAAVAQASDPFAEGYYIFEHGDDGARARFLIGQKPVHLFLPNVGRGAARKPEALVHEPLERLFDALVDPENALSPFELWQQLHPFSRHAEWQDPIPDWEPRELDRLWKNIATLASRAIRNSRATKQLPIYRVYALKPGMTADEIVKTREFVQTSSRRYYLLEDVEAFLLGFFDAEWKGIERVLERYDDRRESLASLDRRAEKFALNAEENTRRARLVEEVRVAAEQARPRLGMFLSRYVELSHLVEALTKHFTPATLQRLEYFLRKAMGPWLRLNEIPVTALTGKDEMGSLDGAYAIEPHTHSGLGKVQARFRRNRPMRLIAHPYRSLFTQAYQTGNDLYVTLPMLARLGFDAVDTNQQLRLLQLAGLRDRARPVASLYDGTFVDTSTDPKGGIASAHARSPLISVAWLPPVIEALGKELRAARSPEAKLLLVNKLREALHSDSAGAWPLTNGIAAFLARQSTIEDEVRSVRGDVHRWDLKARAYPDRKEPILSIASAVGREESFHWVLMVKENRETKELYLLLFLGALHFEIEATGTEFEALTRALYETYPTTSDARGAASETQRELTWLLLRQLFTRIENFMMVYGRHRSQYQIIDWVAKGYAEKPTPEGEAALLKAIELFDEHPLDKVTLRESKSPAQGRIDLQAAEKLGTEGMQPLRYHATQLKAANRDSVEWNTLVEQIAVDVMVREALMRGYTPFDEAKNNYGYDMQFSSKTATPENLYVEIKGVTKLNGNVTLTREEIRFAQEHPGEWLLAILWIDPEKGTAKHFYLSAPDLGAPVAETYEKVEYNLCGLILSNHAAAPPSPPLGLNGRPALVLPLKP